MAIPALIEKPVGASVLVQGMKGLNDQTSLSVVFKKGNFTVENTVDGNGK
jgi:hypothetical protein